MSGVRALIEAPQLPLGQRRAASPSIRRWAQRANAVYLWDFFQFETELDDGRSRNDSLERILGRETARLRRWLRLHRESRPASRLQKASQEDG
jgi:hypothetical protein